MTEEYLFGLGIKASPKWTSLDEEDVAYLDDDIKGFYTEIINLNDDSVLGIKDVDGWVYFGLFSFCSVSGGSKIFDCVFAGDGLASLREFRHTYWGDKGYLYYAPGELIIEALTYLKKYFYLGGEAR